MSWLTDLLRGASKSRAKVPGYTVPAEPYHLSAGQAEAASRQERRKQGAVAARQFLRTNAHSADKGPVLRLGGKDAPAVDAKKRAPIEKGYNAGLGFRRVQHEDPAAARKKRAELEAEEAAFRAKHGPAVEAGTASRPMTKAIGEKNAKVSVRRAHYKDMGLIHEAVNKVRSSKNED